MYNAWKTYPENFSGVSAVCKTFTAMNNVEQKGSAGFTFELSLFMTREWEFEAIWPFRPAASFGNTSGPTRTCQTSRINELCDLIQQKSGQ